MSEQKTTYARRLSLFDGTMVVVGGIIGAGIFLNPSIVAQRLDTPLLVLAAWGIGGAIALIGALCFGELGSRRPEAGGGYVYLREAFGPLPAFLYGWTLLLVINTGGISAVAMTFSYYFGDLMGLGDPLVKPVAIGSVVLLTGINYLGIRPGSITQNIFTVLKLLAVAMLTVAGALLFTGGEGASEGLLDTGRAVAGEGGGWSTVAAMGTALIPVLFAYGGWQHANHVAGEIRRPRVNLPRVTFIGVVIVVTSYLLVNWASLSALGLEGLAASTAPASEVMQALWGDTGSALMSAGIAISTFGFVNLAILAGARVYQAMADDGLFFKRAARLHPRYRTPSYSLIIQGIWIVALILSGSYGQLLDYTVFGDWIFFGLVAATLFWYRARGGDEEVFRMPGYPWLPALFILAAVFVVFSSVVSNLLNAAIGAGLILAGVPVYLYWNSKHRDDQA
ncbi:MAG: amino acid permease [Balneolaceae bacterium]|nr:amino acid permease [Balneolaceae bacterium]